MTLEEARKMAKIAEAADSNCSACVASLTDALQEEFPEFIWKFEGTSQTKHTNTITVEER